MCLFSASLIGVLAVLCYQVFSPFLTLMVWSIILAVTLYPLHQWLARKVGGKQWLASTTLVIVGLLLIITPMALLMNSFADSVRHFIGAVQQNTLAIPAPREGIEKWPLVGKQIHDVSSESRTRPARIRAEHATENQHIGPESSCYGRKHWQRPVAVSSLIPRRQHPDGIR